MQILQKLKYLCFAGMVCAVSGCFTGVESTPKITQKELKKQNVTDTPEKHVLGNLSTEAPVLWQPGRRFYVADNRAARAAWRIEPAFEAGNLKGKFLQLVSTDTVPTLTDRTEIQLTMAVEGDTTQLSFRTGLTPQQWQEVKNFSLPHLIDMEIVDTVKKRLLGNTYYILTSRRTGANADDTLGTRYQPVTVIDVKPESEATPVRVYFRDNAAHTASVVMTLGDSPTARRNFETIFSLSDPRSKYKNITDENWEKIIHGRIAIGMTPEECRLALGSPDSYTRIPTTAGMVERWTYTNGVYLVFEEGLLSAFRQ